MVSGGAHGLDAAGEVGDGGGFGVQELRSQESIRAGGGVALLAVLDMGFVDSGLHAIKATEGPMDLSQAQHGELFGDGFGVVGFAEVVEEQLEICRVFVPEQAVASQQVEASLVEDFGVGWHRYSLSGGATLFARQTQCNGKDLFLVGTAALSTFKLLKIHTNRNTRVL